MRHRINQMLLKLSYWSNYWCRTSQYYINYFKSLKDTLIPYANENILLGGDFNFYLDLKLEKIDTMSNKGDNIIYQKEIISMLDSMNLIDCFRDVFPNIRRNTWHSRGKSSRLNYWLISEHLLNEL